MGNICSSYSSTSTQTGSVHKKRGNLAQEIEDDSQPVKKKTWDDVFDHVVRTDLWEGTTRAARSEWKPYLRKIDVLSRAPRQEIEYERINHMMRGGLPCEDLFDINRKIILYVSSAGIDTEVERTVLMKDVYPFIKETCRLLHVEFEVVDLRWGTNNTEQDDVILKTSRRELQRCCDSNNGFIFLCFLREDYGERILPQEIEEETLDTIMAYLINNEIDTSLIKQFYTLDKNPIRRKYILKDNNIEETVSNTPDIKTRLLQQLIETIPECFPCGQEIISKYCASMYEYEIQAGLKCGQSIFVKTITEKTSNELTDNTKVDTGQSTYNKYNQEQLDRINKEIAKKLEERGDNVFTLTYDEMHEMATGENVMELSDHVCEKILQYVIQYSQTKQTFCKDPVFLEVLLHQKHSLELSQDFYGREKEIETVRKYLEDETIKVPMIVHGVEGVGKSAFMAITAQVVKLPHYVLVVRHVGLTEESTHVKDLLESICIQLASAYHKPLLNTSASFKDIISRFRHCLGFATKKDPIILFLTSLSNLSNENLGHNLRWLLQDKQELPDNVKIVISTTPGPVLDVLRRIQPVGQFLEIAPLCESEVSGILQKKLAGMEQQITFNQTERLVDLYRNSKSLLFLNLAINLASTWRSFDTPKLLEDAVDLFKLFESFLQNIEKNYGPVLVQHALSYITSSKHGLSINELEDILSCDDEVLDEIFQFQSPTVRRIPSRSLKPLRQDLDPFFVERNFRGTTVITWCQPEVAAIATRRYLTSSFNDREPFDRRARTAIADYFDDKCTRGKIYSNLSSTTTEKKYAQIQMRCVMSQPLVLYGKRSTRRQFNTRKLHELPYQQSQLKEWNRFQGIMKLGFLEAKFEDGLGFECVRDISEAAKISESKVLKQLARLIASNLTVLMKEPFAVYQIASQCEQSGPIFKMLKACDARDIPMKFIRNVSDVKEDTTCEMTLLGHSAGVRYCDVSPSGDMIVSTADDGSMNIWYVITGMELAAITSLPLPIDGNGNDVLPSNPCCFSPSGDRIAVGTQDGDVIMLDSSGTTLAEENTDIENITCLKFSHDGKTLVTSFRQGQLYFWDTDTVEHQSTIQLEDVITGLDISPDDQILAIVCARGLVLADMTTRVILSSGAHNLTLDSIEQEVPDVFGMCCVFHPNGKEVLIGSSDNSISQWNVSNGNMVNRINGHLGRVTSIKLNKDGDLMFSASMDKTIKMWSYKTSWTCTSTLVGHSDRVTMVTLDPVKEAYLVSASLDGTLKVWNIEAILKTEEEILERDDGFEEGSDVTDQDGDIDSSENVPFNTLSFSPITGAIVYSKGLDQYCRIRRPGCPTVNSAILPSKVKQACFTADGSNVVILDSGYKPEGKRSGTLKSSLLICDSETGRKCHVIHATEFADDEMPTKFCCGAWFIAIGTNKGDVHVFDDKAFERLQQISWHDEITEMATCTVKNYVIATSFTQAIIWKISLDGYDTVAYLPEVEFNYTKCAFSPLGNCLITCFENGEIHIWNITDKEITLSVSRTEHTSKIKDVSFSRSGDVMVTCADRSMRVWDMTNDAELRCAYYSPIDRLVCVEEDVVLAGDSSGKLNTLTW